MANPDRPLRLFTEADLPEVAQLATHYFGGLHLGKMMEIALEESAIEAEYRVIGDRLLPGMPNNPETQRPNDPSPEVLSD